MIEQNLKIEVFVINERGNWDFLPETGRYLTQKQLIPGINDVICLAGEDWKLANLTDGTDIRHFQSVKLKWYNYATCDVAIQLHYLSF